MYCFSSCCSSSKVGRRERQRFIVECLFMEIFKTRKSILLAMLVHLHSSVKRTVVLVAQSSLAPDWRCLEAWHPLPNSRRWTVYNKRGQNISTILDWSNQLCRYRTHHSSCLSVAFRFTIIDRLTAQMERLLRLIPFQVKLSSRDRKRDWLSD